MADGERALYAYCVLAAGERPPFEGPAGVAAGAGIELVDHGPLSAAVSRVPLEEFGPDALRANLEDMAWLERTARAHDAVLERALAADAVVPMRLCTIFSDEEQLRTMLDRERETLLEALERVRGHGEWSVKVMADPRRAAEAARARAGEQGAGGGGGPGRAFLERKKAERSLREEAGGLIDAAAEDIHARLERAATAAALLPAQRPELSGRSGQMVLNGAYLVPRRRAGAFAAAVEELGDRHRPLGLEIELAGPWAPYNFVAETQLTG